MHIVQFMCGFANQLFQLCLYEKLKELYGPDAVYADISYYDSHYEHGGFKLKPLYDLRYIQTVPEKCVHINESNYFSTEYNDKYSYLYVGFWQNECFFPDDLRFIETLLQINSLSPENQRLLPLISSSNSVAVHVRRGDFINNPWSGNIATKAFFINAINRIEECVENPVFFVFSDDISWCRDHLAFGKNKAILVTGNENQVELDILMMSLSKHFIISNSTFSWWAQRLNRNPSKIVISPEYWYNESFLPDVLNKSCFWHVKNIRKNNNTYDKPFFSILVSVSNPGNHFRRCMSSILNQTYESMEIILVLDSTSDTLRMVKEEYTEWDARIVLIAAREGESLLATRISAMSKANGKYLLFLDSNDYLSEDACRVLYEELNRNPVSTLGFSCRYELQQKTIRSTPALSDESFQAVLLGKNHHIIWNNCFSKELNKKVLKNIDFRFFNLTTDFFLSRIFLYYTVDYRNIDRILYYHMKYTELATANAPKKNAIHEKIDAVNAKWNPLIEFFSEKAPELIPSLQSGEALEICGIFETRQNTKPKASN